MDLRQLSYFIKLIECKSFTKAAERLYISQPALGLQIRNLENEFEVQLLVRHSRGIEPTEAGLLLFQHACELLTRADDLKRLLHDYKKEPRGKVSVGMPPSTNLLLSSVLITRCLTEYPEISLSLAEGFSSVLIEWINDDRLDLACVYNVHALPGLVVEPLYQEDAVFVGAPDFMPEGNGLIPFSEVISQPMILPATNQQFRHRLDEISRSQGLTLNILFELQSEALIKSLVAQGVGYTIIPFSAVQTELEEGKLLARHISEPKISNQMSLVYKEKQPPSKGVRALHSLIRKLVQEEIHRSSEFWYPTDMS